MGAVLGECSWRQVSQIFQITAFDPRGGMTTDACEATTRDARRGSALEPPFQIPTRGAVRTATGPPRVVTDADGEGWSETKKSELAESVTKLRATARPKLGPRPAASTTSASLRAAVA